MKETATVRTIEGTTVILACEDDEHCSGCAAGPACGAGARVYGAANPKAFPLKPGDRVDVSIQRGNAVVAGLMVFLLPVVLFVASYLAAGRAAPSLGDPERSLCGLAGMALGFGAALLYGRTRAARRLPQITGLRSGGR